MTLAFAAGLGAAAGANAQEDQGVYVGGSFGVTRFDGGSDADEISREIRALGFASASTTIDESGTGFKFLLGYQFNRNFAVEGYYADLGSYDIRITTTGPSTTATGDISVTGVGVDLVGIWPVGAVSLLGRVGLIMWDAEATLRGPGGTGTGSSDGSDLKFGGGVEFRLTRTVRLRGELEYYNFDPAITKLSAGVIFRF